MKNDGDRLFDESPVDGVDFLPRSPGVYCIQNRVNGRRYVGLAGTDIHWRCLLHRAELRKGISSNMLMRRDVALHSADAFFFYALQFDGASGHARLADLERAELWFMVQFRSHDETFGYNFEAVHQRTRAARFRDRERKLMRPNSLKYAFLPGVSEFDAINRELLTSWVPGS